MAFIKFFLILLIVFFLIGRIGKFLLRMLTRKAATHMHQEYHRRSDGQGQGPRKHQRPPNGEIKIDYIPDEAKNSGGSFKGGEYIDYEEVK